MERRRWGQALVTIVLCATSACGSDDSSNGSGGAAGGGGSGAAGGGGSGGANPDAPVVTILSPTEGAALKSLDNITVKGTAVDPQDGNLTDPTKLFWYSDKIPEPIGEGPEDPMPPGDLPVGTTVIRFTATDKDGNTGEDQVHVTVE